MKSRANPGHLNAENSDDEEAMAEKLEKDPDYSSSKSIVEPYAIRDHAWNFREHDATNYYDYKNEAPYGYVEHIDFDEPHATNRPYVKPSKAPELCEQKAQALMDSAKNSAEMKFAKAEIDLCVAQLKEDLGTEDAELYKKFAEEEMINAKLYQTYTLTHPLPTYVKRVDQQKELPKNSTKSFSREDPKNSTKSFGKDTPKKNETKSF